MNTSGKDEWMSTGSARELAESRKGGRPVETIFILQILFFLLLLFPAVSHAQGRAGANPHTIMHPDWDTLAAWKEEYRNASAAHIDPEVGLRLKAARSQGRGTSMSLLSYLDYTPKDRDQGYCGNCWVWAGTGLLEIADSVNYGSTRHYRHSIQLLNSCKTDAYACTGGTLTMLTDWYRSEGLTIPWSNTNAYWQDGTRTCGGATSSCVSCTSIATYPNYPIVTIQPEKIETQGVGVGQATAIANVKNVLQQNRAVEFDFCLANQTDWNAFYSFWDYQAESGLWPTDNYCGHTVDLTTVGCHSVLLVGYNDDDADPAKHYWTMVNSWGITTGRPNGLLRMPMVMNYDCTMVSSTGVTQLTRDFWTVSTGGGTNTLTINRTGSGVVASTPTGISCGSSCSASFTTGTVVTLTATPLTGATFTGWSGDCTGTATTCTITMDRGRTVGAAFSSPVTNTLTIAKMNGNGGTGTITSAPQGINCGSTCKYGFTPGTTVTLTASPNGSSGFTGWGRDASTCGTTNPCVLTMNSDRTVSASFMSYTLKASKTGNGTGIISTSPSGISCGTLCSHGFPPGTVTAFSAAPLTGSAFTGWGGACSGTTNPCMVTADGNKSVTASFSLVCSYSLTSPQTISYAYNGGYKTLYLAATNAGNGACPAPGVAVGQDWLSYDKLAFGTANSNKNKGSVRLRALAYTTSSKARQGTVTIDGTLYTVTQAGKACALSALSPAQASFGKSAYTGKTFIATSSPSDCAWTAQVDPSCATCSWIHVTGGSPGTGQGTVTYRIDANGTGKNRTGKVIVALTGTPTVKKVFTIKQTTKP